MSICVCCSCGNSKCIARGYYVYGVV